MASVAYPHPGFLNPVPKHSLHKPLPFDLRSSLFALRARETSQSPLKWPIHHPRQIERITVPNSYGEKLVGLLHETGSKEVVVLCHGFRASKDHEIMRNLAGALTREGISAVRFDFAGNGESEGSFQYGNYQREADDLHAVVLYFLRSNRVVKAILGHSKGGNVVLLYASRYHDVPIVVNVSGRYDLNKGIEERVGKGFIERIKKDGFIDVNGKKGNLVAQLISLELLAGKDQYRITEESLMDRLSTDMHAACLSIEKSCRSET
ncbi:hypothetical protein Syun_026371 [Stephania yunnanensis]|uniref:Serine aminopeptidase S33 domain-containing protein n=1 Tax=Stephania yunnanensis TaxID=152371 RepID=A0AAP0EU56_9MAGN